MPSHRDLFFSILAGERPKQVPFVPDITDWYVLHRTAPGQMPEYSPGSLIPDSSPVHMSPGTMPERFRHFTLMDFYREFDWGFHAHIYDWFDTTYSNGVERVLEQDDSERRIYLQTPKGSLVRKDLRASDGSWCPHEHFVESVEDLRILESVIESERYA